MSQIESTADALRSAGKCKEWLLAANPDAALIKVGFASHVAHDILLVCVADF